MITMTTETISWIGSLKVHQSKNVFTALTLILKNRLLEQQKSLVNLIPLPDIVESDFKKGLVVLQTEGVVNFSTTDKGIVVDLRKTSENNFIEFLDTYPSSNLTLTLTDRTMYSLLLCINKKGSDKKHERYKSEVLDSDIFYKVCCYLNEKTGANFRHTSQDFRKLISARVSEGYTLDDFKKVIDKKVFDWRGKAMSIYIRPKTLFGNNFDSYLNQLTPEMDANNRSKKAEDYLLKIAQEMKSESEESK